MWKIVIISAITVFIVVIAESIYLASYVVHPKCISIEDAKKFESAKGFLRNIEKYTMNRYTVESFDGYKLNTILVPADEPGKKFVIISHGYTYNHIGSIKYVNIYHSLGYSCILYDDRGHGDNIKFNCTLGINESKDLISVIADTYKRYGSGIYLGLHGESMGSGLQIMALKYRPDVRFIVNDCGYASLIDVLAWKVRQQFHLPGWLAYTASFACGLFYGYSFTRVNPIDNLKDNKIPICFIHGAEDNFIDKSQSERMHDETSGYSELHFFPGAGHAKSLESDEERYYKVVEEFLNKVAEADMNI